MSRLPEQPGERIARDRPVRFTFDGKAVQAFAGDTVASALYAGGRRTFSRSFKYHRRRGLLGGAGPSAGTDLVAVDGAPGVRASSEPVREGMVVKHLNATPGLELDVMQASDKFGGPFTPVGFYYKTFIWPRRLWPLYEKVLRNAAGLGKLPKRQAEREWRTEYRRRHADVLVVGGGAAGLRAATDRGAARRRRRARRRRPRARRPAARRGRPRARCPAGGRGARGGGRAADGRARRSAASTGSSRSGRTRRCTRSAPRRLVFATGSIEQPLVFADNDRPGVMLSGGARGLLARYAVKPGERAVVATVGDRGWETAVALQAAGVRILAVADLRPRVTHPAAEALGAHGTEVLAGSTVVQALGAKAVTGAVLGPIDGAGGERSYDCDLIVVAGGEAPAASLPAAGRRPHGLRRGPGPLPAHRSRRDLPRGRRARRGGRAGRRRALRRGGRRRRGARARARATPRAAAPGARPPTGSQSSPASGRDVAVPPPVSGAGRGKCFVDLDEDVTVKDVRQAIAEGYDSMELAKRYTTVTMGPSQGRHSSLAMARLMARETGQTLRDVGQTTARPPWVTVPMGALAGRPFEPAKRSSIHGRHRELGATVAWAGDWRRAYDYGDPQAEALAVHEQAGLIDVSTLGKLLVQGPDAGAFLDRLYPNRFSNLKPGRIRYGVVTSDAGRILDDGTICRLDENSFYVTTTSSGASAVEEWFTWWQAAWRMDLHITDVTQGLSAVNLAGPRAREILGALTGLDTSSDGFGYLDAKRAPIAGVPCLVMRIGFVGEVGYEIHFPSAQGEYVWDAILAAGRPHGIVPFGLEPQRLLRLQKLHVIIGQDTDSESTPYNAAMPWIVKLDKDEDFMGRWALEHANENGGSETALVGFTMANGDVPTEGAAVLDGAAAAGRVTSARYSPQLGKVIGLAWVPSALADDGATITISDGDERFQASVQTRPFYDPDGEVLRS